MSFADLLFGPELIQFLQSLFGAEFNRIFVGISLLGNDEVLVGLCAIVYWCFDKRRGRLVTYILLFGAYLNFYFKILVPSPRPPVDLRIAERNETSFGFPSGHAQDSTTFWTWISFDFRKRMLAVLGTLIVAAIGISRIYLGVHYPGQVIGGWVIGFAFAGLCALIIQQLPAPTGRVQAVQQALFAIASLIPTFLAVWLGAVGEVNPGLVGGYLFGFSLGAIAEDRFVSFRTDVTTAKRILRIIIGGAMTSLVVLALGRIVPDSSLISSFADSFIRGLTVVLIAPAIFKIVERS